MICAKEGRGLIGLLKYFPAGLYEALGRVPVTTLMKVEEVRLGSGKPVLINLEGDIFTVTAFGEMTKTGALGLITTKGEIEETFRLLCDGSVYAMEENIKKGYITTAGGHRVGICGSGVVKNGAVDTIKNISYLNIRISHEVKGAALPVIDSITKGGLHNTLVISPPGGGKTTLLRDICRILGGSDEFSYKVGIADERGEIAAVYNGTEGHSVGNRTCVIDSMPKGLAMEIMLRGMGLDILVTDEIASGDEEIIKKLIGSGVCVIASAHGRDIKDVNMRTNIKTGKGGFDNIICLENKKIREMIRLDS